MDRKGRQLRGVDAPTVTNSEHHAGSTPAEEPPQEGAQRPSDAICHTSLTEVKPVLTAQVTESLEEKVCGIRRHQQMWHASCCHSWSKEMMIPPFLPFRSSFCFLKRSFFTCRKSIRLQKSQGKHSSFSMSSVLLSVMLADSEFLAICVLVLKSRDLIERKTSMHPKYFTMYVTPGPRIFSLECSHPREGLLTKLLL